MAGKTKRLKTQGSRSIYLVFCVLCLVCCVLLASRGFCPAFPGIAGGFAPIVLYAQEESEDKDRAIELPPVKIEIVDTTQLDIPKEKFRSFMKPSSRLYAPLSPKERSWYVPSTSVPEKIREVPVESGREFLFSSTAQAGAPLGLVYQMFLIRGFGNSEALLDVGRSALRSERTAELVSDPSKGLGDFTIDKLKGAFAHQSADFGLRIDAQYDAKQMSYLDESGEEYINDRSLIGLSADWDQELRGNARSSLSFDLSNLKMEGPFPSGREDGLDLKTDLGIKFAWPSFNLVDAGLGIEYFHGDVETAQELLTQELREAILRLYLRDSHIRIWPFVLGAGVEFVADARKSSAEDEDWVLKAYPNPFALLTSQLGSRTVLQFGVERYILGQDFRNLYLDGDYLRLNPNLDIEKTWDLNVCLQHKLTRDFTASVGVFDKEISDLTVFERTGDEILSWMPTSWDSARIYGFISGWKLSLMDGRIEQSIEYVHEIHDQEIPYRPRDKGSLTIAYFAPFGLELSLYGQFCGVRYVDTEDTDVLDGQETLSSYFLWKPRVSKTFGRYASVFLTAEFYIGQDDYQIWEGYGLPDRIVDLGVTLKF